MAGGARFFLCPRHDAFVLIKTFLSFARAVDCEQIANKHSTHCMHRAHKRGLQQRVYKSLHWPTHFTIVKQIPGCVCVCVWFYAAGHDDKIGVCTVDFLFSRVRTHRENKAGAKRTTLTTM